MIFVAFLICLIALATFFEIINFILKPLVFTEKYWIRKNKRINSRMHAILQDAKEVLEKNDIVYYLDGGSIRHKDFIPYFFIYFSSFLTFCLIFFFSVFFFKLAYTCGSLNICAKKYANNMYNRCFNLFGNAGKKNANNSNKKNI